MICDTCKHEPHELGKCKNCNCGESEVSHSDAISTDQTKVVTWQNFKNGNVSTSNVIHIKARKPH